MKTRLALVLLFGWPLVFSTAQDQGIRPTDKKATIADNRQDLGPAGLTRTDVKSVAKGARGSWSPDGKRIAVGQMPFGKGICFVQVVGPEEDQNAPRIPYAFGKASGEVTEFLPDGKDPAWSPDGKWIAFTREVNGGGTTEEVWLTAADQVLTGKKLPTTIRRLGTGVMATWSADSTIVFFSYPLNREICAVRVDKPDAEPTVLWKAVGDQFPDLWYPVVAPNGRHVAYHADGQLRIADMTAQRVVNSWPLDGWRGFLAGWSPDGSRLGYGAFGGEDKGLWVLTFLEPVVEGYALPSQPRQVLWGSSMLPSWSPDRSKLAFDFRVPQRGYEVWVALVDPATAFPRTPPAKHSAGAPEIRLFDGFDGRLALNWQPIRHDPSHVSLSKHPGKLTITTQRGSIHGDEKNDTYGGGIQARDIFVIDNPCSAETDFMMTTCVEDFTPQMQYQQAGLICYDDDDNYLKWGYEFCWPKGGGHTFTCVREVNQKSNFDVAEAKPGITKYWLRFIKRGNKYQYAFSYDGETYVTVGEQTWGEGKPKKLGVLAKNGGNPDATELECKFDFFELRSLSLE